MIICYLTKRDLVTQSASIWKGNSQNLIHHKVYVLQTANRVFNGLVIKMGMTLPCSKQFYSLSLNNFVKEQH